MIRSDANKIRHEIKTGDVVVTGTVTDSGVRYYVLDDTYYQRTDHIAVDDIDRCDNCGAVPGLCDCGDFCSTMPVSPEEADRIEAEYSVAPEESAAFFGE